MEVPALNSLETYESNGLTDRQEQDCSFDRKNEAGVLELEHSRGVRVIVRRHIKGKWVPSIHDQ